MTLVKTTFRFHDIAFVEVVTDIPFVQSFFDAEYGYHRIEPVNQSNDTNQNKQDQKADMPCVTLDFRLNSHNPKGYTFHSHKILARWSYKINIGSGNIYIDAYGNRIAVSMVHHMLVHPSLRWLACNNGTLLLHSGAVSKNNKSLIFTGKGGTGKTTTTSLILSQNQGWQVHADDYVFINKKQSQAYVTRSHLYRDLEKWVPEVKEILSPSERIRLEIFGALRKYTRKGIKWPVRVHPKRLWPNTSIADTASLAAILLLERKDIEKPSLFPISDLDGAANDLLEMNFGEARHFIHLLQEAGSLDDNWLSEWKRTEGLLITNILKTVPAYRLVMPITQIANTTNIGLLPLLDELIK